MRSQSSDRLQAALTARFLKPAIAALREMFFEIRAETDLALGRRGEARYRRPYPYGWCLEITQDVMERLRARMAREPRSAGERAMKLFLLNGGQVQRRWGVLREQFFQNALAAGALYIDVSNDTVDIRKPKVEILPMGEAGLAPVRDAAHYAGIAQSYWGCAVYANTALPSFAPLLPIILVDRSWRIQLHSKNEYMTQLLRSDGFRRSEQWLRGGTEPPAAVVRALREACPSDILALNLETGVDAAVEACRRLRVVPTTVDEACSADVFQPALGCPHVLAA